MNHYSERVSTAEIIQHEAKAISHDLLYQILTTFQAAFTFTLGLITHELVQLWSQLEHDNGKLGSWVVFMILAFIMPFIKERFLEDPLSTRKVSTAVNKAGYGSAHNSIYIPR